MATPAFLGVHVLLAEDPLICEGSRLTLKTSVPHQPLPHSADDSTDAWRGAESCLRTHKALQATELKSTRAPWGQALLAAPLLPQGQRLLRLCEAGPQKEGTERPFFSSLFPAPEVCTHAREERLCQREAVFQPGYWRGPFGKAAHGSEFSPG